MRCPKCAGSLHGVDSREGVTLDFCDGCKGLWFEAGEVASYFELTSDVPDLDTARATQTSSAWSCPKCSTALVSFRYGAPGDLVVDRCLSCGGIWLDRGEVPALERLSAHLESPKSRLLVTMRRARDAGYVVLGVRKG